MSHALALMRRREPEEPGARALFLYGLIAATGFVVGWAAQTLGF